MSIFSIVSGKGGVGKTFISANLSLALGKKGKKVLVVDGDISSGNLTQYLGVRNPYPDLTEFLAGEEDSIDDVLEEFSENVHVLPAGDSLRTILKADISKIENILPEISEDYDYIFVDSPPGISQNSISPIEVSDQLLLILTPDEASVSSAGNIQKVGNILDKRIRGFILNKWESRGFFSRLFGEDTQMSEGKVEARMAIQNLGKIPYDKKVRKSTELGKPLLNRFEDSQASKAIREISDEF